MRRYFRKWSRGRPLSLLVMAVGVALLLASWLAERSWLGPLGGAWAASTLGNVAVTVLLVAPFLYLTRRLDEGLEEAAEEVRVVAHDVRTIAARVEHIEEEVRRIDDLAVDVQTGLATMRESDRDAYRAIGEAPTRAGIRDALAVAIDQGLVGYVDSWGNGRPPRVATNVLSVVEIYASFSLCHAEALAPETLTVRLEDVWGDSLETLTWAPEESVHDFMTRLGRARQKHAPAADTLDVRGVLEGLRDLLLVADKGPDYRPAVEYFPPQWLLTTSHLISVTNGYGFDPVRLLREPSFYRHVASKSWVVEDAFEAAYRVVSALHADEAEGEVDVSPRSFK